MNSIINFFMKFTGKNYTHFQRAISMVPGIIIFLIISPFVIFQISKYLSSFLPLDIPRFFEHVVMLGAFLFSTSLMTWALVELWTKGHGSPAPIAPTTDLVTTGPYKWCRNPIEFGTNIYFLSLGIYFDSLLTGLLCVCFGLILGIGYIKLIEEKEMLLRFGKPYETYLKSVPFMPVPFLS